MLNWYLGKISRKKSSRLIFLAIVDQVKTESPKIGFNFHWKKGIYFCFIPSIYCFHFFWWLYISTSSSLSEIEYEVDSCGVISGIGYGVFGRVSGVGICGGYDGGSGGGGGGGTPVYNENGSTDVSFFTGVTIIISETTVIDTMRVLVYKTTAKTVEAPLPYCTILFWGWGSGDGGGMGTNFTFL